MVAIGSAAVSHKGSGYLLVLMRGAAVAQVYSAIAKGKGFLVVAISSRHLLNLVRLYLVSWQDHVRWMHSTRLLLLFFMFINVPVQF